MGSANTKRLGTGNINDLEVESYTYQEFPRMLYHTIEGETVVNSQEEMEEKLKAGWKKEQVSVSEEEKIADKISWHKAEIVKLEEKLDDLRSFDELKEDEEEEEDERNVTVSVTEEKVETSKQEPPVQRRRRQTVSSREEGEIT